MSFLILIFTIVGSSSCVEVLYQDDQLCKSDLMPYFHDTCPDGTTHIQDGCCLDKDVYSDDCVDLLNPKTHVSDCPSMKSYCTNSLYYTLMHEQCPKTCGFCTGGGGGSTCVDLVNPKTMQSDCPANKNLCQNSVYKDLMKQQCPKTCGYCV